MEKIRVCGAESRLEMQISSILKMDVVELCLRYLEVIKTQELQSLIFEM